MTARRALAMIVAGVLLPTVGACGGGGAEEVTPTSAADQATAAAADPSTPSPSGTPVAPARRARSAVVAQAPHSVVLPSGGIVQVRAVDTTAAGLLDVPDDIRIAGWWRGGARLGDPFGSILLAAHVDSRTQGLGPFAELLSVAPGARVRLQSDDLGQAFVIRSRRLVPQGSLADDSWIFTSSGEARLTLVTCAPPYDPSRGGYQNLAVVTAVPVSSVEQR